MSVIIIQVGQCGNQLGLQIFSDLIQEMKLSPESLSYITKETFFHYKTNDISGDLYANAILIDMESKVIEKSINEANNRDFKFNDKFVIKKQSGSGNNWANGFLNHGPSIENEFIDKVQSMIDLLYTVDSIIIINSLAGGTGSGLGSYLVVILKDNFPYLNLISIVIWPSITGEVIVSSYNTALSISETYKNVDLLIIIDNQNLYETAKNIYKCKKVNFKDINETASKRIVPLIFPVLDKESSYKVSTYTKNSLLYEYSSYLSNDPRFKICDLLSFPEIPIEYISFDNHSWSNLIKDAYKNIKYMKKACFIMRGNDLNESLYFTNNDSQVIKIYSTSQNIRKINKHLTVIVNSDFIIPSLDSLITKASKMLEMNIFTHHYYKYGLENEDFLNCFSFCNQIVYDYSTY